MNISRRSWMAGLATVPAIAGRPAFARAESVTEPVEAFAASADLDALVEKAVKEEQIPGAVLIVGHAGKIVHRKAYGSRSVEPRREAMTLDTIFDAASLTKVVATTSACLKLIEAGKLRINDRVNTYLPEFQGGKSDISVRNLMTHFSGLRPDIDLKPAWTGYETGIQMALAEKSTAPPGTDFVYSDINFILLGEIVRRLAGMTLPEFVRKEVFEPAGMMESLFQPPAALHARVAPTEKVDGQVLRGVVHDPTARNMGGIAGHAGLFTTGSDLALFCEMLLARGQSSGKRIFNELTVIKATSPQSPPNQPSLRGLGWDIDSPFSGNRGELFPIGSFGHTGFTGTSLWIDPLSSTYIVWLSNAVHPNANRPATTPLRARVATIVAASLGITAPGISITGYNETFFGSGLHRLVNRNASALTGLDALAEDRFARLAGKRIGLITNHTGIDREGRHGVDRMVAAGIKVTALFSPEHGFAGTEDRENLGNETDAATGVRVYSLYNKNRRPTAEMLANVDALVFDIQDVGARFYTYTTTMAYCMEAAAERKIPFFVLDRPNPITGNHMEGPVIDTELLSFVTYFPVPLRHGMTLGELAAMFNKEKKIGADLHVVQCRNWQRGDWFDSTGLVWIDPSPNMRSLNAALLYPGLAMLEGSRNYSVGRGTDAPFEQIGAEWIRGAELSALLNTRFIPGVRTYATRFRPTTSNCAGKLIEGVRFVITDREAFSSSRLGLEIAAAITHLYPSKLPLEENRRLIGSRRAIAQLSAGVDAASVQEGGEDDLRAFAKLREQYLLYK